MSKIDVSNMDLYYGDFHALKNINLSIDANEVTAFIGPSGCGKSTLLKSINRMNDLVPGCRITGEMLLDGENIYSGKMDVNGLRKRVGMVFQTISPTDRELMVSVPKRSWMILWNSLFDRQQSGMR